MGLGIIGRSLARHYYTEPDKPNIVVCWRVTETEFKLTKHELLLFETGTVTTFYGASTRKAVKEKWAAAAGVKQRRLPATTS